MRHDPSPTVAAVSTPRGKGGISVIRISGDETLRILEKCFAPKGAPLASRPPRTAVYGEIISDGKVIDTGICVLYEEGRSFTGESMAELSCHGGVWVTRAVLEAVLAAGAAPAGAGEFTRRAFINGKMSLSEAEAVGLLIDADTRSRAAMASGAVRGNLTLAVEKIDGELLDVMTALFAAIDYPEEDVGTEGEERISDVVASSLEKIDELRRTFRTGRAVAEGVRTVICGRPNVGKSSLYNLLLGEERAIVTDVAGTTRDTLEDTVDIGGVTLRLLDTAGIRNTDDRVERIGVERAYSKLDEAELVIFVADGSEGLTTEDTELLDRLKMSKTEKICVINKSDIGCAMTPRDEARIEEVFGTVLSLSSKTGDGKAALEGEISRLFNEGGLDLSSDAVIWSAAQRASLDRASELLSEARDALCSGTPLDAVGVLCESALTELRTVDGRDVSEDIIDGIFSKFCVGK
ncbi:MAG: tRNA uridine-5-carboxymethylaminomethyl(34) synthesis GTPase MnmE [Clostridia bacterium]|nr:tRNA uridine-5-carboxymethylaminomethyl(34) synthesis GTPase MnmE [Clostridia bacterium]